MKLVANKSTGIYQVHFVGMDGKRVRQTTGCRDKEGAKRVVVQSRIKEIEETAKSGRLTQAAISQIMAGSRLTMEQAFDEYKKWAQIDTTSRYTYECSYFPTLTAWMRDMDMHKRSPFTITDTDLNAWINREGPHKLTTRNAWKSALKSFWKFLSIRGWCIGNAALGIRVKETMLTHAQKESKVKQCFTDDEIDRLLVAPRCNEDPFWYAAIVLGRYAGLRLGDIAQLQWDSFCDGSTLKVFTDKTDTKVSLPLDNPRLKKLVQSMISSERQDNTFCWPKECAMIRDPRRRANLSIYFMRICESVGVEGKSFHCLRHTFATELARQGNLTPEIAAWMGHAPRQSSPWSVTERYIHKQD